MVPSSKTLVLRHGTEQRSVYGINEFPARSLIIPNSRDDFWSISGGATSSPDSGVIERSTNQEFILFTEKKHLITSEDGYDNEIKST